MIQLVCADSMQIMEGMTRRNIGGFDMIFLDPPYFEWVDKTPIPSHNKLSALTIQLLKPNGCVFLCGTQPQMVKDWHYWDRFFRFNFELITVKHAGTPPISERTPIRIHENIWCLSRKKDILSNIKLDVRTKKGWTVRARKEAKRMPTRYGKTWMEWKKEVGYIKSVIKVRRIDKNSKEYEGHPAQKPLKIMRLLIKLSTDESDWILDPFAGVGTTLMAATELNRNCLGIEINKEYIRLTKRRFERVRQMKKLERWLR